MSEAVPSELGWIGDCWAQVVNPQVSGGGKPAVAAGPFSLGPREGGRAPIFGAGKKLCPTRVGESKRSENRRRRLALWSEAVSGGDFGDVLLGAAGVPKPLPPLPALLRGEAEGTRVGAEALGPRGTRGGRVLRTRLQILLGDSVGWLRAARSRR